MALYFRSFLHIRGQMAFGSDRELSLSNYLSLPPSVSSRSELEEGGHVWKQTPVSSSSGCGSACPQGKGRREGMWNSVNWTLGYPILPVSSLFFKSLWQEVISSIRLCPILQPPSQPEVEEKNNNKSCTHSGCVSKRVPEGYSESSPSSHYGFQSASH